ncbi:MAG: valine--tRNA ligase [bacterium]|nr:valine--tRNA ligase [bacterium]
MELDKIYNAENVEKKWYKYWIDNKLFNAVPNLERKPFTVVIPPPNVTNILHLGQALNNTIQDIFVRFKRMQGYEAEWIPGVDHAGIATEVMVIAEVLKGKSKSDIGKEEFLEHATNWAEEKKSIILEQLKSLGCSCDWDHTRYTMDPGFQLAVQEAFVRLYKDGLIYKGDYIVNWCPKCATAISDEEVDNEANKGSLYYIKYPIKNEDEYIVVATTRPETMLGDTACAVNPSDEKNKKFIGKTLILPIMTREIKVVSDDAVDPNFGTGVVKITPAHDAMDFEVAERHNLQKIRIMDNYGILNENAGKYRGLTVKEARKKVLEQLESENLLLKTEPYENTIGRCYRCKSIIEPLLSKQWFVNQRELAAPAIKAVETGEIKFYPDRWTGVYLNWMNNVRDWCISRQITWGHPIPVFYCSNGCLPIVEAFTPKVCPKCGGTDIHQDEDVLDTWFSSWLWPFAVFGWPKRTQELGYFYPTTLLSTASEIIFFWVARMVMAGYKFIGKLPFTDVYVHGTVRDSIGRKMSKSLGNGIDPREIIKKYGTDALRFSLITAAGEGQDPHIQENTFFTGRDFANKIWNAYRLISSIPDNPEGFEEEVSDKWIMTKLSTLIQDVTRMLSKYKLQEPGMRIYDFFWHDFCDWYLEIAKLRRKKGVAEKVMSNFLQLLHPFMPFITEEIWKNLEPKEVSIMTSSWPCVKAKWCDATAEEEFELIKDIITVTRMIRAELHISQTQALDINIKCENKDRKTIENNAEYIKTLAKVNNIIFTDSLPKGVIRQLKGVGISIPIEGLVDVKEELSKANAELEKLNPIIKANESKLNSPAFCLKAHPDVVSKTKETTEMLKKKVESIKEAIELLSGKT